jgi:hypothetical protein
MDPNVVIDGAGASALLKSSAAVVDDSFDISLSAGKQTVGNFEMRSTFVAPILKNSFSVTSQEHQWATM